MLKLLTELSDIPGDFRIRLGSVEPRLITEEFVKNLVKLERVCPHFHLSLQSGSTSVLKRMNRHYTAEEYYNSVEILKKYYDRPGITTDIIVGFPEETEKEFNETVEFIKKVGFLKVHVFPYSMRSGTYAAKLSQVADNIKKHRAETLAEVCDMVSREYLKSFEGDSERLLIEEELKGRESFFIGHTDRYIEVALPKTALPTGTKGAEKMFLKVKDMILSDASDERLKQLMIGGKAEIGLTVL